MRKYVVKVTDTALQDIENVHDYIAYELFEPITADKYIRGIYDAILWRKFKQSRKLAPIRISRIIFTLQYCSQMIFIVPSSPAGYS